MEVSLQKAEIDWSSWLAEDAGRGWTVLAENTGSIELAGMNGMVQKYSAAGLDQGEG